jgi:hypothetical protein
LDEGYYRNIFPDFSIDYFQGSFSADCGVRISSISFFCEKCLSDLGVSFLLDFGEAEQLEKNKKRSKSEDLPPADRLKSMI